MTAERARELMRKEADSLSDEEIARQCRVLEEMARLHVRLYDQQQAELRHVSDHGAPAHAPAGERLSPNAALASVKKPTHAAMRPRTRGRAGLRWKVTPELVREMHEMRAAGATIRTIVGAVKLNRTTVDEILRTAKLPLG